MTAAEPAAAPADANSPQLAKGILSLRNCLALSAAVMAPVPDFAEQRSPSLSSGSELPEAETP